MSTHSFPPGGKPWDNQSLPHDEQGYPVVPHELAGGMDSCGCLIVSERGDQLTLSVMNAASPLARWSLRMLAAC